MRTIAILALLLAVVVGVYSFLSLQALQAEILSLRAQVESMEEDVRGLHSPIETEGEVTIYLIRSTATDFLLVPVKRRVTTDPQPLVALDALLAGPKPDEDLQSPLPPGTRLLGLEIREGLATVDFSKEIQDNFLGGAILESHLVMSIVNTLTEFDSIDAVQILVEGEKQESIAGHVSIKEPISHRFHD